MQNYYILSKKYPNFVYQSYKYKIENNYIKVEYHFTIENLIDFKPTWTFHFNNLNNNINNDILDNLIFNLGMVELLSYYKLCCCNNIILKCKNIDDKQKEWFKKLYYKGLGEFFYLNNIDSNKVIINIINDSINDYIIYDSHKVTNNNILIPIGGGKDSIVTIELLKDKFNCSCFIINPNETKLATYNNSNIKDLYVAERVLDNNLLELNKKGFLNGHTPFSAIVALSSTISAYINNITYIALSNEASANQATIIGSDINHQYSKSYEFELDYHLYQKSYIKSNTYYFSLLRIYSELKIASIFSKYSNYFKIFKSCNVNSKYDSWCNKCPKCLFVYIILSPFITKDKLIDIFNYDLYNDQNVSLDIFDSLIGKIKVKPFECVGTVEEVNASLQYLINETKGSLPYLLEYYKSLNIKNYNFNNILDYYNQENIIPDFIKEVL